MINNKIWGLMFVMVLLVSTVSALNIDNTLTYSNNDLKVTLKNGFGLLGEIGEVELKSHPSADYVKPVSPGEVVTMYYDFSNFKEVYNEGLGQVEFIDLRTNKKVQRDYDFVYWGESTRPRIVDGKCSQFTNGTTYNCQHVVDGTENYNTWLPYTSRDIPSENIRIGLRVNVLPGDFIDGVWTIAGKKINRHAEWIQDLDTNLDQYFNFDETSGFVVDDSTNNQDGTRIQAVLNQAGIIDKAYAFGGNTSSRVDTNLASSLDDFTINFWGKTTTASNSVWTGFQDTGTTGALNFEARSTGGTRAFFRLENGTAITTSISSAINDDNWHMLTLRRDGTNVSFWVDGVNIDSQALPQATVVMDCNLTLGVLNACTGLGNAVTADIDEFGLWTRALNDSEIVTHLWNGGAGNTYTEKLEVLLVSPANATISASSSVSLVSNISDPSSLGVQNVTYILNGSVISTNTSGDLGEYVEDLTLDDGTYQWTVEAYDNSNGYAQASNGTAYFYVDTVAPSFTVTGPTDPQTVPFFPNNVTLDVTTIDDNLGACWYNTSDDATNNTYTCNNVANVSFSTAGDKVIYVWANDTAGNENSTSISFYLNYANYSVGYTSPILEATQTNLSINLTATLINSFNASLVWNGTTYDATYSDNGTLGTAYSTITTPQVTTETNGTFFFTYYLNGVMYNTTTFNQTILDLTPLNITSTLCSDLALNYTFADEGNLSALTADVDYNFVYGASGNTSLLKAFGSLSGISNLYVCTNSTLGNYTVSYGEVDYRDSAGHYVDRRNYLFNGSQLTNQVNNITLYDLVDSQQTSFQLEVEDTSLNPYKENYTALIRWYPNLDQYNVVDMGLTDETGSTVIHVKSEDVDYRIGVYNQDGTLLKLAEPVRMVCLVTPCTYTLKISPNEVDYTNFLNVVGSLVYNSTSGIWTYSFVDTSQTTSEMNLTIYKQTGTSTYAVCSSSVTAYTGAVSCNTSIYSGVLRGVVYRSASPPVIIAEKIIDTTTSAFSSTYGLFLTFLVGIPIVFIFAVVSPVAATIGGVLALVPALYFKTINWAILGGIAVLAGIILHFIKRVR